jgi:hypothetical protein
MARKRMLRDGMSDRQTDKIRSEMASERSCDLRVMSEMVRVSASDHHDRSMAVNSRFCHSVVTTMYRW